MGDPTRPEPVTPVVTEIQFRTAPISTIALAQRHGQVRITDTDGRTVAILGAPQDDLPVTPEEATTCDHVWSDPSIGAPPVACTKCGASKVRTPEEAGATGERKLDTFAGGEARYAGGKLDEVVVANPKIVHVERMNDGHIWAGIDLPDGAHLTLDMWTSGYDLFFRCEHEEAREPAEPTGEPQAGAEDRTKPPPGYEVHGDDKTGWGWDPAESFQLSCCWTRAEALAQCWAHYDAHPAVAALATVTRERDEARAGLARVREEADTLRRVCTEIAEVTGYMHEGDGFAPQPCDPSELPRHMRRLREEHDAAQERATAEYRRGVAEERAAAGLDMERVATNFEAEGQPGLAAVLLIMARSHYFGNHHPEHADALSSHVRAKQAEALESAAAACEGLYSLRSVSGAAAWAATWLRDRAASLRKENDQ
jgi:hypothetical protein